MPPHEQLKIGVIGCFYGNADLLPEVLSPWIELKNEGAPILLGGVNAQFKEYADMGYVNDDEATRAVLRAHEKEFDILRIESKPLLEHEARGILLDHFKTRGVGAVWLLDGDELYTKEEIREIIKYIHRVPEFDYYHIHLKNYLFDSVLSRDVFCPPRIVRLERRGGVDAFSWDNEITFSDGSTLNDGVPGIIPRRVAFVRHLTWRKADVRKKIAYCLKHFGYVMFTEDEKTGEVRHNPEWFERFKLPLPVRHPDGSFETPTPFLEVHFLLSEVSEEKQLRSLWTLVQALLVFDRANDARFRLVVVPFRGAVVPSKLLRFLELFDIDIVVHAGSSEERARAVPADMFFFAADAYSYASNSVASLYHAFLYCSRMMNNKKIVLGLADRPELYLGPHVAASRVVLGGGHHWRTTGLTPRVPFFSSKEAVAAPLSEVVTFGALPSLAAPSVSEGNQLGRGAPGRSFNVRMPAI